MPLLALSPWTALVASPADAPPHPGTVTWGSEEGSRRAAILPANHCMAGQAEGRDEGGLEIAQEAELLPVAEMRRARRLPRGRGRAVRPVPREIALSAYDRYRDRPDGKLIVTPRDRADEGRRGQDDHLGVPDAGSRQTRQERHAGAPRAVDGSRVRDAGGSTGGGYDPGRADGGHQPPLQRRLPRGHRGAQHAGLGARRSIYQATPSDRSDRIPWPRAMDVNARELRYNVIGLGGKLHGVPRENRFVITAASEIMAILALAEDIHDLRSRLGTWWSRARTTASPSGPSSSRSPAR